MGNCKQCGKKGIWQMWTNVESSVGWSSQGGHRVVTIPTTYTIPCPKCGGKG